MEPMTVLMANGVWSCKWLAAVRCHEAILGRTSSVLTPDGVVMVVLLPLVWVMERVVEARNDKQEPRDDSRRPQGYQVSPGVVSSRIES